MNVTEIQQALSDIGWPISVDGKSGAQTKEAVSDFQRGYAFSELVIDGNPGTNTQNALQDSLSKGGNCSIYFDPTITTTSELTISKEIRAIASLAE